MKKQFVPISAAILFGLCALLLADGKTDYNHSTDFGRYRTYSWIKVSAGNDLWQDRITRDVDNELQSKGWQKVASEGDARAAAFGSTQNQKTLQTFYGGLSGGWYWG